MSVAPGPPPLRPFGLVLHRDGSWSHEGVSITHPRLRAVFDRSVRYLPEADRYVVQVGRFRGQVEVEGAGFFVRSADPERGEVVLSDGTREPLDPATLELVDGVLHCRVKRELAEGGLPARFTRAAQAALWLAVEERDGAPVLRLRDRLHALPAAWAA